MSDHLEPSFIISTPQNVTVRSCCWAQTPLSPTIGLLLESITVSHSGCMSGPMKWIGKFTVPLPTVSDDEKSNHPSPISISSGSSPGTPGNYNTTFTPESPTIPKPPCCSGKAPVFVLAQKKDPIMTPPSSHKDKVPTWSLMANNAGALACAFLKPAPGFTVPAASLMQKKAPVFVLAKKKEPDKTLPASGSTVPTASLTNQTLQTTKRKPIQVFTRDNVEKAWAQSAPHVKKTWPNDSAPHCYPWPLHFLSNYAH